MSINKGKGSTVQTIAGLLGNVLEWYDFGIYGFFSDTIAEVFFPPAGPHNLVYSYLIFGAAFLCRPLGGLVTGHIGDTLGRKRALVFSMLCMTLPTVAMGCLPTYDRVGGWSIVLLALCRCLQGFSVGGQLISSIVYTLETKPKEHWGFYGSFIDLSSGCGVLLANIVSALMRSFLSDAQLVEWGWRAAFVSGILVAPAALFLHWHGEEYNPNEGEFDAVDDAALNGDSGTVGGYSSMSRRKRPLTEALKKDNWSALVSSILTPMLGGAGYYVTFVWMAVYMQTLLDPPVPGAFWVNLFAYIFGYLLTAVVAGTLSDKFGRHRVMATGAICVGFGAPVMVWIISWGETWKAFGAQWMIGVLLSMFTGPMWAWVPENFEPKVRLTSAALGYNLGVCISAGFSPALATALVNGYGPVSAGVIYPLFATIALLGLGVSVKVQQGKEETHDMITMITKEEAIPLPQLS